MTCRVPNRMTPLLLGLLFIAAVSVWAEEVDLTGRDVGGATGAQDAEIAIAGVQALGEDFSSGSAE